MAKKESKLMQRLRKNLVSLFSVGVCLILFSSFTFAHEGLHEQIIAITARIKRDPKNAALYLQRGELYRLHRDWTRAASDYDRVTRLRPGLTVVDLARGKMLLESRKPQQAKFVLDRFLRQQPDHLEGLITRARVLARMGSRVQAAQDFTKAISLMTAPDPELYLERARVLAEDSEGVGEALKGLDEGINKHGPLVTLQLSAIELELRRKNYDAALTRLDTISAQSERQEMWLVRRGEILQSAGRNEEARVAFRAAVVAIESLPPGRRQNRTVTALEHRARSALN